MIDAPGIYSIPAEEYHADCCPVPSLSSSVAKILVNQSPSHAWHAHARLNPAYESEERTDFDIGSAAHALLLEGDDRMTIIAADSYRTKEAKDARDAARADGRYPVLAAVYKDVQAMAGIARTAIESCPDLPGLRLADGKAEQVLAWTETVNGQTIWLRIRADWMKHDNSVVLDYKSTTDAEPNAFTRHVSRMGYHFQNSFYRRGVRKLTGRDPLFVNVAQEKTAPYAVSFHGCAPSLMSIADDLVELSLLMWAACMKSGRWPAYDQRIHYAEAEAWQLAEHEERAIGIPYKPELLWSKEEIAR